MYHRKRGKQPLLAKCTSFAVSLQSFKVDADDCTIGLLLAKGYYKPKSNFIMELVTYVEGGSNSGYFGMSLGEVTDRESEWLLFFCNCL